MLLAASPEIMAICYVAGVQRSNASPEVMGNYGFTLDLAFRHKMTPPPYPSSRPVDHQLWTTTAHSPELQSIDREFEAVPFSVMVHEPLDTQVVNRRVPTLEEATGITYSSYNRVDIPLPTHLKQPRVSFGGWVGWRRVGGSLNPTIPLGYSMSVLELIDSVYPQIKEAFFKGGPIE